MRRRTLPLLPALLALAGCGGATALGTSPNGGTQLPRQAPAKRVRVRLVSANATGLRGTALLTPARDRQKTRVTVSLDRDPSRRLSVEIAVGSCPRMLALQPEAVLGTMEHGLASWRTPVRLASLLSMPAAVVVRTPSPTRGGPIAACGEIGR